MFGAISESTSSRQTGSRNSSDRTLRSNYQAFTAKMPDCVHSLREESRSGNEGKKDLAETMRIEMQLDNLLVRDIASLCQCIASANTSDHDSD